MSSPRLPHNSYLSRRQSGQVRLFSELRKSGYQNCRKSIHVTVDTAFTTADKKRPSIRPIVVRMKACTTTSSMVETVRRFKQPMVELSGRKRGVGCISLVSTTLCGQTIPVVRPEHSEAILSPSLIPEPPSTFVKHLDRSLAHLNVWGRGSEHLYPQTNKEKPQPRTTHVTTGRARPRGPLA